MPTTNHCVSRCQRIVSFGIAPLLTVCLWLLSGCAQQEASRVVREDIHGQATQSATETEDTQPTEESSDTEGQTSNPGETETAEPDTASLSETPQPETQDAPPTDVTDSVSDASDADSDGWVAGSELDCDDANADVNPGMPETIGNGVDDNCDGQIDEAPDTQTQECDGQAFAIEFVPTNLMILLDRSLSMEDTDYAPTKWVQAGAAIDTLVTDYDDDINFGLDIFPKDGWCSASGKVTKDVAPGNAAAIVSTLEGASPAGQTPLCSALRQLASASYAPGLHTGSAGSYVVVVSDGEDSCGGSSCNLFGNATASHMTSAAQLLLKAGISTFVIGFGDGVSPSQLNAIAQAGGTAFDTYLDAANEAELKAALESIASSIASCSFELKSPDASADPDEVNFFFDTVAVPFDAGCSSGAGWDWTDPSHTEVVFCEAACEQLKTGAVVQVSAEFGCKQVTL